LDELRLKSISKYEIACFDVILCKSGTYSRAGVHREDWRIGEVVTVTCLAAKDGSKHWGFLKQIKYHSDGHVLVFRQGGE